MATSEKIAIYKKFWRKLIGDAEIEWLMEVTKKPEFQVDKAIAASVKKDEDGKVIENSLWRCGNDIRAAYRQRHCAEMGHFFGCECNGNPRRCPHSRNFSAVTWETDEQTGNLIHFTFGGRTCAKARAFLQSKIEGNYKPTSRDIEAEVEGFY